MSYFPRIYPSLSRYLEDEWSCLEIPLRLKKEGFECISPVEVSDDILVSRDNAIHYFLKILIIRILHLEA